jgi:GntR family transcriptional regulator
VSSLPTRESPHRLDRSGSIPLYVQLAAVLREQIQRGDFKPDEKIPSENELNRIYGISRMTIRQVLAQLVNDDLLFRVQGKGTFVGHPKIAAHAPAYTGIREQLERIGFTTIRVLSSQIVPADAAVAEHLKITPADPVHQLRSIRTIGNEPISLDTSFVPALLAPGLNTDDLANRQLCVVLADEFGLRMSRVNESLESTMPTAGEAKLLRIRRTRPLLLLRQEICDPAGHGFEYSRILFRGDKIRLEFHYDQ